MGARGLEHPCRIRRAAGSNHKSIAVVSSRGGLAGLGAKVEHKIDYGINVQISFEILVEVQQMHYFCCLQRLQVQIEGLPSLTVEAAGFD